MNPAWFSAWQPGDPLVWAPGNPGTGLTIPPRLSDCTGLHPEWYPFQIQVDACDWDDPDPVPLVGRQLRVPNWP